MLPVREPSVGIVSAAWALVVLSAVRALGLVRPIGVLPIIEALRIALVGGGALLAGYLVLRTTAPDRRRISHFEPDIMRCALAGLATGAVVGSLALGAGAIPDATDSPGSTQQIAFVLVALGMILGVILGTLAGLLYGGYTALAFRRLRIGSLDAREGALVVAALTTTMVAGFSALVHARSALVDTVGIASLLFAGLCFASAAEVDFRRARWLARVIEGEEPGWKVEPAAADMRLPSFVEGAGNDCVLVQSTPGQAGAFRSGPVAAMPVAFVDTGAAVVVRRLRSRGTLYAAGAAVAGLLLPGAMFALVVSTAHSPPDWDNKPELIERQVALTDLVATKRAMCALRASDRHLVCWGSGAGAILGSRNIATRRPQPSARLGRIRAFALDEIYGCAVPEDGDHRAVCWTLADPEPRPIGPGDVVAVAVAGTSALAVTADGAVWRWGEDSWGESKTKEPEPVPGLEGIAQVSATYTHALALGRDGTVYCWGRPYGKACGVEAPSGTRIPPRALGGPFVGIRAWSSESWLFRPEGRGALRLGAEHHEGRLRTEDARQLAGSEHEMCALYDRGYVACTRGDKAGPNGVLQQSVREIAGNDDGFCAVTASELWCWHGYDLTWSFMQ